MADPAPRKILVVDDNHDSAESLQLLLSLLGHQVVTAFDGPSALLTAAEHRPEVVILDLGLPGMSGYEVAPKLRAIPELHAVAIFALSGFGGPRDREKTRAAGFDAHLVKPVDVDALGALLREFGTKK